MSYEYMTGLGGPRTFFNPELARQSAESGDRTPPPPPGVVSLGPPAPAPTPIKSPSILDYMPRIAVPLPDPKTAEETLKQAESVADAAKTEVSAFEDALKVAQDAQDKIIQTSAPDTTDAQALANQLAAQQAVINKLKKALTAAQAASSTTANEQVKALEAQIAKLEKELAAGVATNEQVVALQVQIGQLEQAKSVAEVAANEQVVAMQGQITQLEQAMAAAGTNSAAQVQALQEQVAVLTQQLRAAQGSAASAEVEASEAEAEYQEVAPWYYRYRWHMAIGALVLGGGYLYTKKRAVAE